MLRCLRGFVAISCLTLCLPAFAEDYSWPQWRGANRDDISKETGLLKEWPEGGPKPVWSNSDIGLGYSGFAVLEGRLFTMGAREDTEFLICLDVNDGRELWSARIGSLLENGWGDGPRGTPAVANGHVFALGGQGTVVCAAVSNGEVFWRKSLTSLGGKKPNWGFCESVLLDGDRVVCTPGGSDGSIVSLDVKTGDVVWQSKELTAKAGYSSIVPVLLNDQRQYIQLFADTLVGVSASDGKLLWQTDWPGKTAVIPTPVYRDGHVFVTSGYGVGCSLVKIGPDNKPQEVYFNKNMKNHHGGVVMLGDHLYGYSDGGGWMCMDFKTGDVVWSEKSALGKGCLTFADGRLYCVDERDGTVVLADASPTAWKEHGRFKMQNQTSRRSPKGKIWSHPVVCNGRLFLRDQDQLTCYDVKGQ